MKRFLIALVPTLLLVGLVALYVMRPPAIDIAPSCPAPTYQAVEIPAGTITPGSDGVYMEELNGTPQSINSFWLDKYEVTNAQFARFVAATNYRTVAERTPDPAAHPDIPAALLTPGAAVFQRPARITSDDISQWWRFIEGANWQQPFGPGSGITDKGADPVVHLTRADAAAYAQWVGGRLPTEAEWEYAARGGATTPFPWGNRLVPADRHMANIWHGIFPVLNEGQDGFEGIAPVGCYPANGYGLHDMIGNVWELTAEGFDPARRTPSGDSAPVTIKGGSYLCASNYCARYRPAARHPQERDMGTNHIGFRVAYDTRPAS